MGEVSGINRGQEVNFNMSPSRCYDDGGLAALAQDWNNLSVDEKRSRIEEVSSQLKTLLTQATDPHYQLEIKHSLEMLEFAPLVLDQATEKLDYLGNVMQLEADRFTFGLSDIPPVYIPALDLLTRYGSLVTDKNKEEITALFRHVYTEISSLDQEQIYYGILIPSSKINGEALTAALSAFSDGLQEVTRDSPHWSFVSSDISNMVGYLASVIKA